MDYSGVLSLTFKNWWKYKKYWFIALLGLFNPFIFSFVGIGVFDPGQYITYLHSTNRPFPDSFQANSTYGVGLFETILAIVFIVSLILFIFYVLIIGNMFFSGLIKAYSVSNETGKSLGILKVLKMGSKYWLKLIAQKLLISSPLLVIVGIFTFVMTIFSIISYRESSTSLTNSPSSSAFTFLLTICCFEVLIFVLAFLVQVVFEFASRYFVIDGHGVIESISISLKFVRKNLKIVVMSVLLYFVIGLLSYLIVLIPSIITGFLIVGVFIVTPSLINADPVFAAIIFLITTGIASLVYLFGAALAATLNTSFWNSLFMKIKEYQKELTN